MDDLKEAADRASIYAGIAKKHVQLLRGVLELMKNEDRVQVFDLLREGYCRACGRKLERPLDFCQCENDE